MRIRNLFLCVPVVLMLATSSQGGFVVNIIPGPTLAGNAAALAAFNRAADQWENIFTDNITVTIDADLAPLGAGILGSASSVILQGTFDGIRNQMVIDAAAEIDDAIVAMLPTAAQFSAFVPFGIGLANAIQASKANLKALGFLGLDANFGLSDAAITFSTNFGFDFDNGNGVGAGLFDFETVAAHEIGHAMGFFSVVDIVDFAVANGLSGNVAVNPLDLFRFGLAANPATPAEFTTFSRNLVPNTPAFFDDLDNEYRMSTGRITGDGRQASHWLDDDLSGLNIGIMDPTLAPVSVFQITAADIRALDLIGWDFVPRGPAVPEPTSLALLGIGASFTALGRFRRRRGSNATSAA